MRDLAPLSVREAERLVTMPKVVEEAPPWQRRPSQANFMVCEPTLFDTDGIAIGSLRLRLERKIPARVAGCLDLYTLYWLQRGKWYRIFQLEVCPSYKVSHRDRRHGVILYGPHIHYIKNRVDQPAAKAVSCPYDCGHYREWLQYFLDACNIDWQTDVVDPFEQDGGLDLS